MKSGGYLVSWQNISDIDILLDQILNDFFGQGIPTFKSFVERRLTTNTNYMKIE